MDVNVMVKKVGLLFLWWLSFWTGLRLGHFFPKAGSGGYSRIRSRIYKVGLRPVPPRRIKVVCAIYLVGMFRESVDTLLGRQLPDLAQSGCEASSHVTYDHSNIISQPDMTTI